MSSLAKNDQIGLIFEEKLERRELELPILPKVAAAVIELSTDEDANAKQLTALIQGDQSLAGHIMRIANSPIYRPLTAFVSLQQAIARLGITTIGDIALATSLNSSLFAAAGYEKLLMQMWYKALCCSAWSREIARMRRTNVEASFLSGLLCQIGKPIVVQGIAEFELSEAEMQVFIDRYYVRSGALLAKIWKLPEIVGQVIIQHLDQSYKSSNADVVRNVQGGLFIAAQGIDQGLDKQQQQNLNFYEEDVLLLQEKQTVVDAWVDAVDT